MKMNLTAAALAIAVALAGCKPANDHDHDHGQGRSHEQGHSHDHGHSHGQEQEGHGNGHTHDETLQLTAYSGGFEVFAEAAPFVVGQAGDVLAHFSHLSNFKPLTEGSVTASLTVGANTMRQTLEGPVKPGIYKFSLRPTAAGKGSLTFDIKTPGGASQVIVPGITVYTNEHDAHEAAAQLAVTGGDAVAFTKEQSWKVDFATTEVSREPFGQVIRAMAQVQPSQGNEWMVAAKTGGVVSFSNNNLVEGRTVNAGQALFSIDGGNMADNNLQVRYAEAEGEYIRAKAEYERKAELAVDNIVSQTDLLRARTEFTNAEAAYNNLRNNFAAGRQIVSSPISGFVTRVLVRNGEYAEAGQPVLVVSQNSDMVIKADLQPRYFDMLGEITSANIRLLNSNRVYTLEELGGRLISYGKSTDIANPLVPVLFEVNNKAGLLSGSFVELFIKTQTNAQAITVPNEAIVEEMGSFFVFVQITPELFEKRAVRKGATDGARSEIAEGVKEGERVVSKGAILVKLAQGSGALDAHAGHVH